MVGANSLSAGGVTIARVAAEVGSDDLVDVARAAFEQAGERAVRQCGHTAATVAALRLAAHRCDGDFDVAAACDAFDVPRSRVSHACEVIERDVAPPARLDDVDSLRREVALVRELLDECERASVDSSGAAMGPVGAPTSEPERTLRSGGDGPSSHDSDASLAGGASSEHAAEPPLEPGDEHGFEFTLGERDGRTVVDDAADAPAVASIADLDEEGLRAHLRRLEDDLEMAKLGVELYVHSVDEE